MSHITRDINRLLDEYNNVKLDPESHEKNLGEVEDELNKITNDGKNVRDIFTNVYYINDISCAKKEKREWWITILHSSSRYQ